MGVFELDTITCMDALALMDGLPAQSVDAIISDLPYGVTNCAWDTIVPFAEWWPRVRHVLKPRGVFVTTASQPFTSALVMSNPAWFRCEWVWEKDNGTNFLMMDIQPFRVHENILIFADETPVYNAQMQSGKPYRAEAGMVYRSYLGAFERGTLTINSGERYPRTILKINQERGHHPTQKPVALYEYLIKTYTNPGAVVLDPFCGSGTTAIAARNTGRHFICGDVSPEYVAIAQKRLQDTDPFLPTQIDDNHTQLSLFAQEDEA